MITKRCKTSAGCKAKKKTAHKIGATRKKYDRTAYKPKETMQIK